MTASTILFFLIFLPLLLAGLILLNNQRGAQQRGRQQRAADIARVLADVHGRSVAWCWGDDKEEVCGAGRGRAGRDGTGGDVVVAIDLLQWGLRGDFSMVAGL
uniref:Uncharacterized protein n=1 Tax=Oryza sativa subsp. japonica TaxID=39947 RepID=Q6ES02_ORYSJ|nr:hypothetical protein [Oryza sativa Japonica Group]BAD28568.1 hypothetical protein [Oryza sativa Japonica Group]